eukprot:CAMPEP_0204897108 /NCGR_PEP_ID=MMETSP1397-20131031/525_1 /ASSEMBLY_ACC=CAM_ASM_000891 /TAXON_ID=49980 /ORGANISM="Climacostomum Climacostomum virens, Strain Stock W-24" /LENGTH=115 /DNA_ID=CAMNT_0052064813 /DNA_START=263 /DNA_END=607 /DNA_ORIENTATION=+
MPIASTCEPDNTLVRRNLEVEARSSGVSEANSLALVGSQVDLVVVKMPIASTCEPDNTLVRRNLEVEARSSGVSEANSLALVGSQVDLVDQVACMTSTMQSSWSNPNSLLALPAW